MTDTQSHSLLAARRPRWWTVVVVVLSFAVIAGVVVVGMAPARLVASKTAPGVCEAHGEQMTPYARVPGGAHDVGRRVSADGVPDGVEIDPTAGSLYFVTISEPQQTILSRLVAPDEPLIRWMTECEKYGDQTPQQRREMSLQMMATSEDDAKYVALRSLGYEAELHHLGVEVTQFVCMGELVEGECTDLPPAAAQLELGDVIRVADGHDISSTEDLTDAMVGMQAGDTVELTVERDDEELDVSAELIENPNEPSPAIIGFLPHNPYYVELPFDVEIDTGSIGGPSAGLAFTLALIDALSPGELARDLEVAVTGTIEVWGNEDDGAVGAIGGLVQKVEAARKMGVDVFLVPAAQGVQELEDARRIAGDDVDVVPVATLEEAVDALAARGGDPIDLHPLHP